MENDNLRRIRGLSSLIGNTPLLAIKFKFRQRQRMLYAKAENLNMTGHTCCDPNECMEAASGDIIDEAALPHCPRRH